MTFAAQLARLRRSRGWSQEALAERAGLSQRHISFLETGRAQPGHRSLMRLFEALALKGWEQRGLLASLNPAARPVVAPAPDEGVVDRLIKRLSLWPAYAYRPDGSLVQANGAMLRLLDRTAPGEDLWRATAPSGGPNIYDLALHPAGLLRWMDNPEEVVPETIRRLRIEAAGDPALLPVVRRLERFPAVVAFGTGKAMPPPVLIERYRLGDEILSVISVVSHLASPGEQELDLLRIESFVPADASSEALLG
ncbi:MAG: helix-turn-helix transcriptional regulator [Porphyrobacter sp.]|jgi:transcriptional regulator with XRE-family HTH domain|nr:helix-turn-helix transcriptional regulator [Porphyrobacter sp.]